MKSDERTISVLSAQAHKYCPIGGWNQSRFPWFIKESTS